MPELMLSRSGMLSACLPVLLAAAQSTPPAGGEHQVRAAKVLREGKGEGRGEGVRLGCACL